MTSTGQVLAEQRERGMSGRTQFERIKRALESIRVTATSSDRAVTVEMAVGGAVVDLRIAPEAMAKSPDAMSRSILEAIRAALVLIAERTSEQVAPLTGRSINVEAIASGRLPGLDGEDDDARPASRPAERYLPADDE